MTKTISSVNILSFVIYGAVLAALWTFVFGLWYWILGWSFGASATWIDMNLGNWTRYTVDTFLTVFWRALINAVGGAFAGLVIAVVYNAVAGIMGGVKLNIDEPQ